MCDGGAGGGGEGIHPLAGVKTLDGSDDTQPCWAVEHFLRLPRAVADVGHGPAHALCQPMGAVASLGVSSASATLAEAPLVMHRAALLCRHLASERGVLDPAWTSEGTSPLLAAHHSLQALAAAASDASHAASLLGALAALQSSSSVDVEAIVGAVVSAVPSDGRALELIPVLAAALGAAQQLAGLPSAAGAVQRLVHSGRAWALVGLWRLHMLVRSDRHAEAAHVCLTFRFLARRSQPLLQ